MLAGCCTYTRCAQDIKQLGSVLDIAVSCPIFDTQIAQGLLSLAGADAISTAASSGSAKAPQPTGPTQHSLEQLLQAYGFGGSAKGGSQSVEEAAAGAARLVAVMDGQMSVARGSQAFKRLVVQLSAAARSKAGEGEQGLLGGNWLGALMAGHVRAKSTVLA